MCCKYWSHLWDLNPGPMLYESIAKLLEQQQQQEVMKLGKASLPAGLPDLIVLIRSWDTFPAHIKSAILALAKL